MKKNLTYPVIFCLFVILFSACVKDTDFDQANDIMPTPVVELDLIYFNLEASDFFDTDTSTPILTVRDTTDLRFLNDGISDNLIRAEFFFKFTNSIPREFNVLFEFLGDTNDTTYVTQTLVNEGTTQIPTITEFIHNVEGESLERLTQASKVVVSVTIPSSNANLEGDLNLQSKTTYFLEF